MNRRLLAAGLAAGLLAGCQGGDSVVPMDQKSFAMELKAGDRRALLREFKTIQGKNTGDIFTVADIKVVKDTVYHGVVGKIIQATAWELDPDTVSRYDERALLVAEGGQVSVYYFKGGNYGGVSVGLLKRAAYDTAVFADRIIQLEYPLILNRKWNIRAADDSNAVAALTKEMVGQETLEFDGKRYACDVFIMHGFADLKSWVSAVGLLKAQVDYGAEPISDSLGNIIDTTHSIENYRLLKLNPSDQEVEDMKTEYRRQSK